jgi:mannan endo-1,4-beta-mannosidase
LRCGGCRKRARKFQKRSVVQCQNAVTGKPDFNGLGTRERTTLEGGINPLLDWVSEMSAFVRRLDPNHPIGVGDEGFEPERLPDVPAIDFGTCHLYPDYSPGESVAAFGVRWIRQHIEEGALFCG